MVTLHRHQEDAVAELSNGKVLWGGVGSGKTLTAIAYYMAKEAPRNLYVITTAKKRDSLDWEKEAVKYGIGKEEGATLAGLLKVDSWNNISKYVDVKDAFFIFDEQRLVGKGAWVKAFLKITQQNRWILLSATPGDTWIDYIPVFLANGFYKNRSEFLREHVLYEPYAKYPKVKGYLNERRLRVYKSRVLVHMPYVSRAEAIFRYEKVGYNQELYDVVWKKRWNPWTEKPIKSLAELFYLLRRVVNSDDSRFYAVREILKKHPKLIIYYSYNYELEILRELAEEGETLWNAPPQNSVNTSLSNSSSLDKVQEPCPSAFLAMPPSTHNGSLKSITGGLCETCGGTGVPIRIRAGIPYSERCIRQDQLTTCQCVSAAWQPSVPSGSPIANGNTTSTKTFGIESPGPEFAVAEWNGHKHEPIPTTERWVYLVQYVSGAEGWNCIETDSMLFFSLTHSYKLFRQAQGRIDRLDTPFSRLNYYILSSDSPIDRGIQKALREKRSFTESELSDLEDDSC